MKTKELIPMDELGIYANDKYKVLIDSRMVAKYFEKRHDHVVRDIDNLIAEKEPDDIPRFGDISTRAGLSLEFAKENYHLMSYKDELGRTHKMYALTRNGLLLLAMGYTGKKAMRIKEAYLRRLDELEEQIKYLLHLREQYRPLTDAIKSAHENPKFYDYSNEADMLNRIVLGMTAKQYREKYNIPKSEPIRPHFSPNELALMDRLQTIDCGFVLAVPDRQQRKQMLEYQAMKWWEEHKDVSDAPALRSRAEVAAND